MNGSGDTERVFVLCSNESALSISAVNIWLWIWEIMIQPKDYFPSQCLKVNVSCHVAAVNLFPLLFSWTTSQPGCVIILCGEPNMISVWFTYFLCRPDLLNAALIPFLFVFFGWKKNLSDLISVSQQIGTLTQPGCIISCADFNKHSAACHSEDLIVNSAKLNFFLHLKKKTWLHSTLFL